MKARKQTKKTDSYKVAPLELDRPRLMAGWVEEPALLFADNHEHVDPKTGIPLYGPRSLGTCRHKREVHVGIIGTSESVDLARRYYDQASYGVDGDDDHAPFPGCRRIGASAAISSSTPSWSNSSPAPNIRTFSASKGAGTASRSCCSSWNSRCGC